MEKTTAATKPVTQVKETKPEKISVDDITKIFSEISKLVEDVRKVMKRIERIEKKIGMR
jgi:hypothetical protein